MLLIKGTAMPLALWNKATESPVKTGDSDFYARLPLKFLRKLSLSSTNDTTIAVSLPQRALFNVTMLNTVLTLLAKNVGKHYYISIFYHKSLKSRVTNNNKEVHEEIC